MKSELPSAQQQQEIIASKQRGRVILSKEFTFEASHVLPKHPGKCSRLHGHSWKLKVQVDGLVDPETGFVVDYGELKDCVNEFIIDDIDHQHLGQFDIEYDDIYHQVVKAVFGPLFYPSSENLIQAFRRILEPLIPELAKPWQDVKLAGLELNETCTSACIWRRSDC